MLHLALGSGERGCVPGPPSWRLSSHRPCGDTGAWASSAPLSLGIAFFPTEWFWGSAIPDNPTPCSMSTYEQSPSLVSYPQH